MITDFHNNIVNNSNIIQHQSSPSSIGTFLLEVRRLGAFRFRKVNGSSKWVSLSLLITSVRIPWTQIPSAHRPSGYCKLPIPCLFKRTITSSRYQNFPRTCNRYSKYTCHCHASYPWYKNQYKSTHSIEKTSISLNHHDCSI